LKIRIDLNYLNLPLVGAYYIVLQRPGCKR